MKHGKAARDEAAKPCVTEDTLEIIRTMQNKIFTIPLFGNEEAVEELNKFLRGNKVANISKSLVQQGDLSKSISAT